MEVINTIKHLVADRDKEPLGKKRSPHWPAVRKKHLEQFPDKETDTIPDVNGHDSPIAITKITLAHHKEDKDYYVKLKKAMPNG